MNSPLENANFSPCYPTPYYVKYVHSHLSIPHRAISQCYYKNNSAAKEGREGGGSSEPRDALRTPRAEVREKYLEVKRLRRLHFSFRLPVISIRNKLTKRKIAMEYM